MRLGGSQRGWTLIELILIMVLLAIAAAIAMPNVSNMAGMRASALARKLQADMSYAQELAMTKRVRYRVYFNLAPAPVPQGYAIVNDADGDGTWGEAGEFARDPLGGGSISVTVNTGNYAGVTLAGIGFAGQYVEFDTLGVPYSSAGSLGAVTSVTVSGGTTNQTVSVTPQTGSVRIP
jgi:Tfp pilus assembly protein FimT